MFLKECRESLRDRRMLLNALFLGPLLGPVLFVDAAALRPSPARSTQAEQAAAGGR